MKKILFTMLCLITSWHGFAQSAPIIEGTSYYLPKVALKITLQIEKTVFTPGEYADYANLYFHKGDDVRYGKTTYSVLNMAMEDYGVPDTAKFFSAKISPKLSLQKVFTTKDGILLSVNREPKEMPVSQNIVFASSAQNKKRKTVNPRDYMTEEILSAGSKDKMAQLCAKEIKDIREARNELSRGQAETLPKDGEQLRLMMNTMKEQEDALMSLFTGTTITDTLVEEFTICPDGEIQRYPVFRFSDAFGVCDADDLSGAPYYITVKDLHQTPQDTRTEKDIQKQKDETGLFVNIPGRAKVTVFQEENAIMDKTYAFPQFGRVENISAALFAKKVATSYEMNPTSGSMMNMKSEEITK